MIRTTVISGLALSLFPSFGCMRPTYSTVIVAEADYGSPITQQDAQAKATTFLKTYLKDPMSAQYEWKSVKPAWIHMQPTAFNPRTYGHSLEVLVNAKNSYGGYVGFTQFRFFFRNGALMQVAEFQDGRIWWQIHPPPR